MVEAGGDIHDSSTSARRPPAGRGGYTPTLPVSDCPEMYTSGVSRQEEHAQLPRRSRLIVPFRNTCTADSRRGLGPLDIPLELRSRDDIYRSEPQSLSRGSPNFSCVARCTTADAHMYIARRTLQHRRCTQVHRPAYLAPPPMHTCTSPGVPCPTADVCLCIGRRTLHHPRGTAVHRPAYLAPPSAYTRA
jgi:hypothetical protein